MKVFITGATGYIGYNVAQAFRRAGHQVWGLTRSEEKKEMLARQEIRPVVGNMQDPGSYRSVAEKCAVLIHTAFDYEADTVDLDLKTVESFIETGASGAQPKTFIYTSGCWVIGDTGKGMADETTPLDPIDIVAWRPNHEIMVLAAEEVDGIVIRPGCVYGKEGGLTGLWFNGAEEGSLQVVGDGSNYWTMVHVDDLADAYLRAAESRMSGEDFNISDRSRWTVRRMTKAVARVTGYDGDIQYTPVEKAAEEMGPMAEALAVNQHVDARKAVDLLGWRPNHGGFVDEIEDCYRAWKAHNRS
ncbi:MAG: NAD-dependent epimerase/dehydratase family protein [Balneolaceae bacterium]|nr:NAD-dependent epimerase/dehydratase family protein [Balneolaceae bacterium]